MLKNVLFLRIVLVLGAVCAAGAGLVGYSYLKPTAEASAPIESVAAASALTGDSVHAINPSNASASFTIDEVLRGEPFTVVGATDQVAGEFAFSAANPAASRLGPITINARTLATDNASRNRALGNQILSTSTYEYITFTPSQLSGLPNRIQAGQPVTFQATGDLTIKGVSRPATFDITLTQQPDGSVHASAKSTVNYADWGVTIPSVPFVASVAQNVTLALTFEA